MIPHEHHRPFGADRFGAAAERIARFFGTAAYIGGQTVVVIVWIAINVLAVSLRWDPYPFILLNLAFSTQAAYAAPLILLAQTRQADRDKHQAEHDEQQRAAIAREHAQILAAVHDKVDETTPGGLQIINAKLDELLAERDA